ncbi:MAG: GCN5-related N-acetyltransferase [Crocinitomicaceae bacterium]|jgi:predicted GNAT family N-acyltransferase|nr:GCN5-related N-acetyltransferase [Crocinitomicaceae bacterium]
MTAQQETPKAIEIRAPKTGHEWDAYYDLRYRVLREPLNQPKGTEKNEGDETGIHFAYFQNGTILAVARLDLQENQQAQVRFVAVESNLQGLGIGKKIMQAVEGHSTELGIRKIILHARDYAVPFYLGLNYTLIEPSYKLFDVLQHFLMEKELQLK